jgi:adenylyltransferase/sulfurtransferase
MEEPMPLSETEIARFARQLLLPAFGEAGQERLRSARVRVVGSALVSGPAALYLADAGVGQIWVDDAAIVAQKDRGGWIFPPEKDGARRAEAASEAIRSASGLTSTTLVKPKDGPTAVLICAEGPDEVRAVSEEARREDLPYVVAEVRGDGGAVVVVPVGAPCYQCAFRASIAESPTPTGAAVMGALAALELVLLISGASQAPQNRRVDLVRGQPLARETTRQAGCSCTPKATDVAPAATT